MDHTVLFDGWMDHTVLLDAVDGSHSFIGCVGWITQSYFMWWVYHTIWSDGLVDRRWITYAILF